MGTGVALGHGSKQLAHGTTRKEQKDQRSDKDDSHGQELDKGRKVVRE